MRRKYQKLFLERKKRNLSCEDMGKILGISTAYYWQIENRRRRLFYIEAIRIAHIFHLKPDDLFYEND